MSKIGLNINLGAVPDRPRLIRILRGMNKTRAHLIMTGGTDPAKERQDVINLMNEVGLPDVQYIHRLYSREEGNWRNLSAAKYRPIYHAMQPHERIITEVPANEAGATDNKTFVDDQLQHIAYALEAGQRLAAGGVWGVGGPHESFIENGTYDALLRGIHAANIGRNVFNARVYWDCHEYFYVWSECGAGFADVPYEVMLDPATLRNHWKPKEAWDIRKGRWLIRRSDWVALRCQEIGITPVPMIFSEYGWDGVDNPITQLNHLVKAPGQTPEAWVKNFGLNANSTNTGFADKLRDKYIVPPYNGLRGVGAQRNIAKAIYPELSFGQYVRKILTHHNDDILHPDHIFVAELFTWSWSGEWGGKNNTSGHNYGDENIDDDVIAVGQLPDPTPLGTTPVPPPVPTEPPPLELKPIRMQGYDNAAGKPVKVRVRATPSTSATVLGELVPAPTVTDGWISIAEPTPADGWIWSYVEFGTLKGWLAMSFVRRDNDIPNPNPLPDFRMWYEQDLVRQRQYHISQVAEHTEEILQIDNKLELLRSA